MTSIFDLGVFLFVMYVILYKFDFSDGLQKNIVITFTRLLLLFYFSFPKSRK